MSSPHLQSIDDSSCQVLKNMSSSQPLIWPYLFQTDCNLKLPILATILPLTHVRAGMVLVRSEDPLTKA